MFLVREGRFDDDDVVRRRHLRCLVALRNLGLFSVQAFFLLYGDKLIARDGGDRGRGGGSYFRRLFSFFFGCLLGWGCVDFQGFNGFL